MRNLILTSCTVTPPTAPPINHSIVHISVDTNRNGVWISSGLSLHFISRQHTQHEELSLSGYLTDDDRPIGMECLSEMGVVCIATRKGEVLTYNVETKEAEVVGSVIDGIDVMGWSPDQDLVVMVTGVRNIIIMTREFDVLLEVSIFNSEFGEAQPVSVGWGKKETQFHGSLGKPSTHAPATQVSDPAHQSHDDACNISWRGDGEYFAVSAINPSTGVRCLRVWSRDGSLYSTSEPVAGLGSSLDWAPRGHLIASHVSKPPPAGSGDVVFFERNGLRHGEFPLRGEGLKVKRLLWNADSSVLGVWLEKNEENTSLIQLWCSSNYHWYLKQEIPSVKATPTDNEMQFAGMVWDPILPLRLHTILTNGQYIQYNWRRGVVSSTSLHHSNDSTVAVIDGELLLLTPFRKLIVPPPMSAHCLTFPCPVVMATFAPPPHPNNLVVVLSSGQINLVSYNNGKYEISDSISIPYMEGDDGRFSLHHLRQIVWAEDDVLLGVTCRSRDQFNDCIVEFEIRDTILQEKRSTSCGGCVLCLHGNPDTKSVAFEDDSGKVFRYKNGEFCPLLTAGGDHVTFGGLSCDHMSLTTMGNDEECVIGLCSERRQLLINNEPVFIGCTSFSITDEFLLITSDKLFTIPKSISPIELSSRGGENSEGRSIERGAVLIASLVSDTRVVLQIPRGNLETISPRPLVLSLARKHLDRLEFGKAFLIMRKHRINLNFLCDHNPSGFMSNCTLIIDQMSSVNHLNLFLTELRNEDVTRSMYPPPDWYKTQSRSAETDTHSSWYGSESKINRVCDSMISALTRAGEIKYSLPIVTAYIKKEPKELENVLLKIKQLDKDTAPSIDEVIKYTLVLVDVNELYHTALGLYDFNLVLTVAEKSQKDPKEYLPFLNELREISDEHYQRYRINMFLKRYHKALENITNCSDRFDDCISLVKDQSLYSTALALYTDKRSKEFIEISKLYGEFLMNKGQFKEAALIYQSAGLLHSSMAAYERSGHWEYVFNLSSMLGLTDEEKVVIAKRMSSHMMSQSRYEGAARILIDHAHDIEGGIEALVGGGLWAESLRYVYLYHKLELIDSLIKPKLLKSVNNHLIFIETQEELYTRYTSRLSVVREEKRKKMQSIEDGTYTVDEKEGDIFSDTSTVTGATSSHLSRATRTSAKSAKNRRKAERKKHSLKEGSQYEDIALVEAIKDIITQANNLQDTIGSLLMTLCIFQLSQEATTLQNSFSLFLQTLSSRLSQVWNPAELLPWQPVTGPQSTVNEIVLSMKGEGGGMTDSSRTFLFSPPVLNTTMNWKLNII